MKGIQMRKIILILMCALCLLGCQKETEIVAEPVSGKIAEREWGEMPFDKIIPHNQNLLTGVGDLSEEAIGMRPVAVMVNNAKQARPQYGISQADIIFEIPVEGKITRLMALYADYTKVPDICPIRSCRYYYPALAKGFDAFYIHWGSDQTILGYVNSLGIDKYDGLSNPHGLFERDYNRINAGYSLEHTGYFKGTEFAKAIKEDGKRTELKEEKKDTAFRFCGMNETVIPEGEKCNQIEIDFGPTASSFLYDETEGIYYKKMNGTAHVDAVTGETLSFENIFILETSMYVRDEAGHLQLDWAGHSGAEGYFISNGAMQKIHWAKENSSESGYLRFYKENGEELTINRGKSYIAYCSYGEASFQ